MRTSVILIHLCLLLSQVSDCCPSFLNRELAAPADLWMCSVTSALCKALLGQKGVASTCWLESWLGITHCLPEDSFGLYAWWTCHWKLTQRPYPGLHRRRKDYETQERLGQFIGRTGPSPCQHSHGAFLATCYRVKWAFFTDLTSLSSYCCNFQACTEQYLDLWCIMNKCASVTLIRLCLEAVWFFVVQCSN